MKSHCDIWELGNRWDTPSSGSLILAPALTIYGLVSYAREWGKMSCVWKCFSPLAVCCRCIAFIGIICIDKLSSGMINNHLFQSLNTVYLSAYVCVCFTMTVSFMLICTFASFHFFSIPSHSLWKCEQKLWKRNKKQKMNKSNTLYFVAVFDA